MGNAGAGEKRVIHVVPGELNNEERFSQIAGLTEQYLVLCIVRRWAAASVHFHSDISPSYVRL